MGAMNLLAPTNGRQYLGADVVGGTESAAPEGVVPDVLRDAGASPAAAPEPLVFGLTPMQLGLAALAVWFVFGKR
jgi:hypothetical protein